jgi:hypothetical protein
MDETGGEHRVRHIAHAFVVLGGGEDPVGAAMQDPGGVLPVEENQAHPIDGEANRELDAVVDAQPATRGLQRRGP